MNETKQEKSSQDKKVSIIRAEDFKEIFATHALPMAFQQQLVQISFLQENLSPYEITAREGKSSSNINVELTSSMSEVAHVTLPLDGMFQLIVGFFQHVSNIPAFPEKLREKILNEVKKSLNKE